jgi:polyisoprenoid-binding protein YceI
MSVTVKQESGSGLVPAGTWQVDPAHSSIEFQVKHMMIATVKGRFTKFAGTLEAGEDGTLRADGTVKSASIDTHDETRNEHLRSADFFDAATYPELSFVTTEIAPTGGSGLRVAGELTIKGTTKPIELTGTVQGTGLDPWGNERVALELRGEIDRREFGLTWNQALETGGVLVSDRVDIELDVQAVKMAARNEAA